jgi:hypothetical protein
MPPIKGMAYLLFDHEKNTFYLNNIGEYIYRYISEFNTKPRI